MLIDGSRNNTRTFFDSISLQTIRKICRYFINDCKSVQLYSDNHRWILNRLKRILPLTIAGDRMRPPSRIAQKTCNISQEDIQFFQGGTLYASFNHGLPALISANDLFLTRPFEKVQGATQVAQQLEPRHGILQLKKGYRKVAKSSRALPGSVLNVN